jgi:hypothetical protein
LRSPGALAIDSVGSIGTLTNSGQIVGAVDLLGGSGDTLDNFGQIYGDVALAGGDLLSNEGQVYGDVTLASRDALTNTGLIDGDVTLGAWDTFHMGSGEVTGTITASRGDLFEFSGNFGHETIGNFAAGIGEAHDSIRIATGDFASFAALSRSMLQVGSDVVISLSATDSITLIGVRVSSLVSADFKLA